MGATIMITEQELISARVASVSMWGHFKTQQEAEESRYMMRTSCLDGWFGDVADIMRDGRDDAWAMFHLTRGCWEYRRPYVEEIVDTFAPLFGDDVYVYDNQTLGPRVVYRLERGMHKEAVHAFNVFLRYSWGRLHEWPIQESGPDAQTMWQAHLDRIKWDIKPLDSIGYITHSNFCPPTNISRSIGFTSQDYVRIMYEIMSNGMREFPWHEGSLIPTPGAVTMKSYVFSMALTQYATEFAKTLENYDPFD